MFGLFEKKKIIIYVDFENVHEQGLKGIETLTENDSVYIFYSKNANNLSFDLHLTLNKSLAKSESIKCETGKNAMDFVISTLIGAHITKYGKDYNYIIVSKYTGYDAVIDYWKDFEVKRIVNLSQVYGKEEVVEELVKKNVKPKQNKQAQVKKQKPKQQPKKKHKINVRSRIGMLIKGINKTDMNKVEAIVKTGNTNTYNKLLSDKFGTKGNDYYNKLKPLFNEISKEV